STFWVISTCWFCVSTFFGLSRHVGSASPHFFVLSRHVGFASPHFFGLSRHVGFASRHSLCYLYMSVPRLHIFRIISTCCGALGISVYVSCVSISPNIFGTISTCYDLISLVTSNIHYFR